MASSLLNWKKSAIKEFNCVYGHSEQTPHLSAEGVELPTKFSKRGGLTGFQFLEEGCWEKGGDFFQEGCSFYIKNKLKSVIFNGKKSL